MLPFWAFNYFTNSNQSYFTIKIISSNDDLSWSCRMTMLSLLWSGMWFVGATRIGFWTCIWSMRRAGFGFNAEKTQLVLFDWSNNRWWYWGELGENVLEEKSFFKRLELTFFSKLDWGSLYFLLKLPPRKSEPAFVLGSFVLLRLLCISINLSYVHAWNTAVMSGRVCP